MDQIEIINLGSSSSGNAYVLRKNKECVLVEAGFDYDKLLKKFLLNNISICDIKSVITTHQHSDHSKAIHDFIKLGIPVYATQNSYYLDEIGKPNCFVLKDGSKYKLSNWLKVIAFQTNHDVESYGFMLLDTENNESLLFINDTRLFDFKYKEIPFNIIFIECNHIKQQLEIALQQAINKNDLGRVKKYERQALHHLSLLNCKALLNQMNLSQTKAIFLIHLSNELGNPTIMQQEIKSVYNINTFICDRNGGIQ